jgi:polyphosphate kinase 2 (PPK2 family)
MLEKLDLSQSLTREEYVFNRTRYQLQLRELAYQLYVQKRSLVMVYEGWDAGGKGGNIKRVTERLDPRGYEVLPIAAPKGEDATHHYLWRFWRRLRPPDEKQILIFDRSWYGRVMVERIEGFCTEEEWKRAYREINEFERQLADHGKILAKFWIHISQDEQLRRFEARRDTAYKAWKLTEEDWRNRARWDRYEAAVEDMLLRTSTLTAPWTIVEGNDKWFSRVKTLRTLVELLSKELDYQPSEVQIAGTISEKGENDMAKKGKKDKKKKQGKKDKKKGGKKKKQARDRRKSTKLFLDKYYATRALTPRSGFSQPGARCVQ